MSSLPPKPPKINVPKGPSFSRKGIRMHDPSASSIGAATPSKQITDASKEAIQNDPIVGGAMPQNRIGRYTDLGLPDQT